MSSNLFFGVLAAVLGLTGCAFSERSLPLEILEEVPLPQTSLPSAVVGCQSADYLAGRDASFICVLSRDTLQSVFPLNDGPIDPDSPYDDPSRRLDVAAGVQVRFSGEPFLTFFSSGSSGSGSRDTVYLADRISQRVLYRKNVRELYDEMARDAGLGGVNIEGAALSGSSLFLFHGDRKGGSNVIFQFPREAFYRYVTAMTDITPAFEFLEVSLPLVEGNFPVFSDAFYLSRENALLFSAGLFDGEGNSPIGSCIGVIPLHDPEKTTMAAFRSSKGLMPLSIEALDLQSRTKDGLILKAYGNELKDGEARLWRFLYRPFVGEAEK